MPHPSREVPVRSANAYLPLAKYTHVCAAARAAGGRANHCACLNENRDETFLHGLHVNRLRCRQNLCPDLHPVAFEDLCRFAEIFELGPCARADVCLVYLCALEFSGRRDVAWRKRLCHSGFELFNFICKDFRVFSVRVTGYWSVFCVSPLPKVRKGRFVRLYDSVLGACLGSHIC